MKDRSGLTLVELIIALGAATGLLLASASLISEMRRREKVSYDDLMQLAEQRLAGQVLRRDLIRVTPSFNLLQLPADGGAGGFFVVNRALGCSEKLPECRRTLTLVPGGSVSQMILLLDRPASSTITYDPAKAFSLSGTVHTYQGINYLNTVNLTQPALPDRFANGRLYLLRSLGEVPVSVEGAPQCHCGGTLQACSATCTGKRSVPYFRSSFYLGLASGVPEDGNGGSLGKVTPAQLPELFHYEHPASSTLVFGATPEVFLKTLPTLGDVISKAELREVSMVRFRVTASGDLYRAEWTGAGEDGFQGQELLLAKKVKKIQLKRESVSVPVVNFSIELEAPK